MNRKANILIKTILPLSTIAVGYWMYSLYSQDQLWGDLPLYFYLTLWLSFVFLFKHRLPETDTKCKWLILSTLSGVLLSLGFPDIPLTPLMFIGFIPLLYVEHELSTAGESRWTLFKYSYHTFVIWNILTTYWVGNSALVAGGFAIWTNSLLMTIPILLYREIKQIFAGKYDMAAFIVFWISFEKIHQMWELSWPWLTLGNAFSKFPSWVQWYEYTGTFGGTFWVLFANYLGFRIFKKYKTESSWDKPLIIKISLVVLIPFLISLGMYFNYSPVGNEKEIVVVQPNYEPHYKKFATSEREVLGNFIRLSKEKVTPNTAYLVFPETSFGNVKTNTYKSSNAIKTLDRFVKQYDNLNLLVGVSAYKVFNDGEVLPKRTIRHMTNGKSYENYNAMLQLNKTDEISLYKKNKFVPGAEIFPFSKVLFFFEFIIVRKLGGSTAGLGGQAERTPFVSPQGKVGPSICYESIYGEYMAGFVRNGAQALFVSTNDGWWDNTPGHIQHLDFARLRAIETRKDVVRSANSGISAFINQRGDIVQKTKYNTEASIKGNALFNEKITFYTQWGDIIARISFLISALLLILGLKTKLMEGKKV